MLRIISTAILGVALALPLSALAESSVDTTAPEATVIAANQDAVTVPTVPSEPTEQRENKARKHNARRGSNQSAAEFRFTSPYAFPLQTLPLAIPNVAVFSF